MLDLAFTKKFECAEMLMPQGFQKMNANDEFDYAIMHR